MKDWHLQVRVGDGEWHEYWRIPTAGGTAAHKIVNSRHPMTRVVGLRDVMVPPPGLEPGTSRLTVGCSAFLSYGGTVPKATWTFLTDGPRRLILGNKKDTE